MRPMFFSYIMFLKRYESIIQTGGSFYVKKDRKLF